MAAQGRFIVDDVQSQGRLVIRDCAGAARAGLILGRGLRGGILAAGRGVTGLGISGGGVRPCFGGGRGGTFNTLRLAYRLGRRVIELDV